MSDKVSQTKRVIATRLVRATRPGRRSIYLFIIGVIILVVGMFFTIWPIAQISIKPEVHSLTDDFQLKVDLDITSPNLNLQIIPARIKAIGEDDNLLTQHHYFIRNVENTSLVIFQNDLNSVIINNLSKIVGQDAVILPPTIKITEGKWQASPSGHMFYTDIAASGQFYSHLPINSWPQEIAGLNIKEASKILSNKPGVDKVKIKLYPYFFSYISQKLPKNQSNIRFTLDTN